MEKAAVQAQQILSLNQLRKTLPDSENEKQKLRLEDVKCILWYCDKTYVSEVETGFINTQADDKKWMNVWNDGESWKPTGED